MTIQSNPKRIILFLMISIIFSACQPEPSPTVTPTVTPTPFPTSPPRSPTPVPTETATLRPSSTPFPTFSPVPTLTPVPTNTPTPAFLGFGETVGPFRDDFSDPASGWPVDQGEEWGFFYDSGGYQMYSNIPNAEVCASRTRGHTSYIVEANVTKLEGPDDAYFGVTCRKTGPNYFTFAISGSGDYSIYKTINGKPELLVTGSSLAIFKGNETNHLKASCIGSTLSFEVNNREVVSILDEGPQFGSFIGLVVGTLSEGGIQVKFDNFNGYPADGAEPVPTFTPNTNPAATETATPTATP